jgi:hypothetical protein
MCVNSESLSNEIDERELHFENHSEQRICTFLGLVIDLREEPYQNVCHWICANPESLLSKIDENGSQNSKYAEQRI